MTQRLTIDQARQLAVDALMRSRTSADNAAAVARALVAAELAGQAGHGLRRLEAYCAQAIAGKVDGFARPVVAKPRPSALAVDAANGFAYPAFEAALSELAPLARAQGIATAGIRRSHHAGVAGLPVEQLAGQGLVALMFANTPSAMAPWGSNRPLYGTNPIAFAAPLTDSDPVVVDVSLSTVARGRIMAAAQKNEAIPQGWAFDAEGRPTSDPAAALKGTMAPLGDAKGTALALMVELLSAGLTGANYASDASSFFDDKGGPPGVGQLLIAIDPASFGDGALERFARLAAAIEGAEGARLPGRRRQEIAAQLASEGIPVDDALIERIRGLGVRD